MKTAKREKELNKVIDQIMRKYAGNTKVRRYLKLGGSKEVKELSRLISSPKVKEFFKVFETVPVKEFLAELEAAGKVFEDLGAAIENEISRPSALPNHCREASQPEEAAT
jgi:hypothetical protein